MNEPYFSIITPMYNREDTIERAIESCLSQSFKDFEMIIVDDGSTDGSVSIASRYIDPRIIILRHETNRGPCPARNTGIVRSVGRWCLMLDSDFSLLPGALDNLYERTLIAASDVGNVASSCLWDCSWGAGNVTPLPNVPDDVIDYEGYLRWYETLTVPEYLNCIRREVFFEVQYRIAVHGRQVFILIWRESGNSM
jgi:glycosyltransferase involved in cell wall biosynthesis